MKKRDVNDGTIGVGLTEKQKSEAKLALKTMKSIEANLNEKPVFLKKGESVRFKELKSQQKRSKKARLNKDLKRKQKTKKWQREQLKKRK